MKKKFKLLVLPSVSNMQQVIDKFAFPVELTKGDFRDLEIIFCDEGVKIFHKGIDLKEFSFVWLSSSWRSRDLAYAVQLYLNQNNVPNTYIEKGTSKITDHMSFSLEGIDCPSTLFVGHKNIEKILPRVKEVCGYPLIIKETKGSRGVSSVKIENEQELLVEMERLPKYKKYLFQKYISNEYDWGIMIANGVVVSGEKSYPCEGEFRNNACNGAKEVFVDPSEIPEYLKNMAINSSKTLNLQWSRADIIIEKGTERPYLLEVNRLPGITSKTSEVEGAYAFISSHINALAV